MINTLRAGARPSFGSAPATPASQIFARDASDSDSGSGTDSSDDEPAAPAAQAGRYAGAGRRKQRAARRSASQHAW
jgi:hypothetical protein